jgi:hypothetical protein
MAFNPSTGLVYVPIASAGTFSFTGTNTFELTPGRQVWGPARRPRCRTCTARRCTANTRPGSRPASGPAEHSLGVGSGDADRTLVWRRRREPGWRRCLDRGEPRVPDHAAGTLARLRSR